MTVKEPSIAASFFLSIIMHLMLFGGAAAAYFYKPSTPPRNVERLVVQLEGMASHTQAEKKIAVEEKKEELPLVEKPVEPPPEPKEKPKPKPKEKPAPRKVKPMEEAVIERIKPEEELPVPAPQAPSDQVDINREEQMLMSVQDDLTAINRYLVSFKKKLAENLIYPKEAKRKEYTGIPTVKLSILMDGSVPADSVSIQKSSGYAALDEAAMEAIKQSSPFPPPPRALENVAVEIVFNVK